MAWSTPNFYVTDETITSESTMYCIIDGAVSQLSYGGNLTVHDSLNVALTEKGVFNNELSKAGYQYWGPSGEVSGKYILPFIVFIGEKYYSNIFGIDCKHNTFGNYCFYNTFGNNCDFNTFGDNCCSNTFGD